MRRSRVGAAAVAGALAVTSFLVASAAAEDESPAGVAVELPETVELKFLNGRGNKNVIYGDQRQEFAGDKPWTLAESPEILAQPSANGGQPRYFGGRQRIGVASAGEKGSQTDSISPGEVLTLTRGEVLATDGRLFNGLVVHLEGSGTAEIVAKLGEKEVKTETLEVAPFIYTDGKWDENVKNDVVTPEGEDPGPLFTDVVFDTLEFGAAEGSEGSYGIKGFRETIFLLTPPSTVVGTLEDEVTIEGTNGTQSASVQCIAEDEEENCGGASLLTQVSLTEVDGQRRVDVTFPGKDSNVVTPLLQVEINWGPQDPGSTFPNITPTVFDPNPGDDVDGEPVKDCAVTGVPTGPGDNCLRSAGFTFDGDYTETYAFISDPRWFR